MTIDRLVGLSMKCERQIQPVESIVKCDSLKQGFFIDLRFLSIKAMASECEDAKKSTLVASSVKMRPIKMQCAYMKIFMLLLRIDN